MIQNFDSSHQFFLYNEVSFRKSFGSILDLNFPTSEEDILVHAIEGEGLNNHQPFDLNTSIYIFI